MLINDAAADNSFLMMIGVPQSAMRGWRITCPVGAIFCIGDIPLHNDAKTFQIDAYLLDICNNSDIILRAPWLANIGRITMGLQLHGDAVLAGRMSDLLHHRPLTAYTTDSCSHFQLRRP